MREGLEGSLPEALEVGFQSNELTGSLPEALEVLQALVTLEFQYNVFTGSLPDCLALLRRLRSSGEAIAND